MQFFFGLGEQRPPKCTDHFFVSVQDKICPQFLKLPDMPGSQQVPGPRSTPSLPPLSRESVHPVSEGGRRDGTFEIALPPLHAPLPDRDHQATPALSGPAPPARYPARPPPRLRHESLLLRQPGRASQDKKKRVRGAREGGVQPEKRRDDDPPTTATTTTTTTQRYDRPRCVSPSPAAHELRRGRRPESDGSSHHLPLSPLLIRHARCRCRSQRRPRRAARPLFYSSPTPTVPSTSNFRTSVCDFRTPVHLHHFDTRRVWTRSRSTTPPITHPPSRASRCIPIHQARHCHARSPCADRAGSVGTVGDACTAALLVQTPASGWTTARIMAPPTPTRENPPSLTA